MQKPIKLFDFLYYQHEKHPLEKCMGRNVAGNWQFYSTSQMIEAVNKLSAGLIELGLQPGDKVAISSYKNRPEWMIVDLACSQVGVISVPLYSTISPREYEFILNDAAVSYAFVGADDLYEKVTTAQPKVPTLKKVFTMDEQAGKPFWETLFHDGHRDEIEKRKAAVNPDELATIIYTSGTTGNPKGVMLNHRNIATVVYATDKAIPLVSGENVLSFLPLCHIFERAATYVFLYQCAEIYFTGTDNLGGETGDLRTVRPRFFTTVPRLLEKVYEAIYNRGLELTGVKKKLFFWALSLTDDFEYGKSYGFMGNLKRSIADKLIFSKWREAMGGRVKSIATGAAPCPEKILKVFCAAGITITEGYGLTETSPALTVTMPDPKFAKVGTCGPPIAEVDIRIDRSEGEYRNDEGEIIAHGPNIMMGYYNNEAATAAAFKEIDGKRFFKTGDVGKFVTNSSGVKCLKITDRKKELLKTSGGKYVAPAPIESKLRESFLIEQVMVVGDKKKFVSAVIVPAEEALKDWCKNNGVAWSNICDVVKNEKVIAEYDTIVKNVNPHFSHIEQIKKFALLDCNWEPTKTDGTEAELTPTMKLKRRVIRDKYRAQIDAMYVG